MLARQSGQDDVVVGTDLANRTQLDTEKLIGFFVNLLPIRARFDKDLDFKQCSLEPANPLWARTRIRICPSTNWLKSSIPERSLTHNPLVQVLFVMQNTPQAVQEFGGMKLGPLGVSSTSRFDLVLFINDPEGSPFATWMYNPNLFDASTIARMAALYETLLRSVAADAEIRLETLREQLAESERQLRDHDQKDFQQASLRKLKQIRRKAVSQT